MIQPNGSYRSHPLCSTEMHGGNLLATVVEWVFHFEPGGTVRLTVDVLEPTTNEREVKRSREIEGQGTFSIEQHGFLYGKFATLKFYARPIEGRADLLVCSADHGMPGTEFSFTISPDETSA